MEFKYAVKNDTEEILRLYKSVLYSDGCLWDEEYPNRELCERDIETNSLLCLWDKGKIIAAVSYDSDEELDEFEIWDRKLGKTRELARLVVSKEYRNQGIARKMLLKGMEELKKRGYKAVHFLVSPKNQRAVNSYAALNFSRAGECDYVGHHWYAYEKSLYAIEKSITKDFCYTIWNPFIEAIKKYDLIKDGDCIAVCISGGKDSMLLAKLMMMLKEYGMYDISLKFLMADMGYSRQNLNLVEFNSLTLQIETTVLKADISPDKEDNRTNPCFLCSRMRRGFLYRRAKEMGCNKIALGHHYDDVIETILMGMLYGSQIQTMLPVIASDNVENMELIRPMYLIEEKDIYDWQKKNNMKFVKCACALADKDGEGNTTRLKVKKLLKELAHDNPMVRKNIFGSVQNVDVTKIMSYKINGQRITAWKKPD